MKKKLKELFFKFVFLCNLDKIHIINSLCSMDISVPENLT